MKDRIKELMESQHMTQKMFAQFIGISEGSLSGVFKERTRPTLDIVDKIHARFPKLNIDWLLFGKAPMFLDDEGKKRQGPEGAASGSSSSALGQPSLSPSLFSGQDQGDGESTVGNSNQGRTTVIKYVDKPQRKITEIRVFFDDQTWESFVPKS